MAGNVHRLRDRPGETGKITVNIRYVDLGHIDLLVSEGFYSNRTAAPSLTFKRRAMPQKLILIIA